MNNNRLKKILSIITSMNSIEEELIDILNEEQEYFDNMPENLQYSSRGERAENAIDNLEESIESLYSSIEYLNEIE